MRNFRRLVAIAAFFVMSGSALSAQEGAKNYRSGEPGVVAPVLVRETHARFTDQARKKRVQGVVQLEAVVLEDGTVGDVKVTKSLEESLDQAAVEAMKQWLFKPGQRDGKAVRVLIDVEMTFTLK